MLPVLQRRIESETAVLRETEAFLKNRPETKRVTTASARINVIKRVPRRIKVIKGVPRCDS